jgi:uncharacterized membrane protein YeaQ/YmgE (transglycosylase-associated protein family)
MTASLMGWILVGLIAGVAGRLLWRGIAPGGFVAPILIGIAGALLGGYLGRAVGAFGPQDPGGWAAAAGGSAVLLAGYRLSLAKRG